MPLYGPRLAARWFMRPVFLATVAFLTLLAATGALGFRSWAEREATRQGVERSNQVTEALDRLRADISALENERRGYLLTRDQTYLEQNNVSEDSVQQEISALQALVDDDPLQSLRAEHLALVAASKLPSMNKILTTESTSGRDAALALLEGLDEINLQIDQMQDVERLLLARLQVRVDTLQHNTIWFIVAAVIVAINFAVVAFALARIEAVRRRKATEENVRLSSDLEIREAKIRRLVDSNIIGIMITDLGGEIRDGLAQGFGRTAGRVAMGKGGPRNRRPHRCGPGRPTLQERIVERVLLLRPGLLILAVDDRALRLPDAVDQVARARPVYGIDRLAQAVALGQVVRVAHCRLRTFSRHDIG